MLRKTLSAVCAGAAVMGEGPRGLRLRPAVPHRPLRPRCPMVAPINLDDAKKAAAAAVEEVKKIGAPPDAVAIVDHGGFLIYFERMDNTQLGSVEVAIEKARSAALFRRPSKVFEDALAAAGSDCVFSLCTGRCPLKVVCR